MVNSGYKKSGHHSLFDLGGFETGPLGIIFDHYIKVQLSSVGGAVNTKGTGEGSGFYGRGSLLVHFPVSPFWEHLCI